MLVAGWAKFICLFFQCMFLGDGESTCMTSLLCLAGLLRAKTSNIWSFHFREKGYFMETSIKTKTFLHIFPILELHLFDVMGNDTH